MKFEDNEYSKIFANEEFGYWKITVLQPQLNAKGQPLKDKKGQLKPDKELTDTEQVPLTYPGGIEAFMKKEVRPFAPHAWVDEDKTVIGYELSFTKYFYKPVQLRTLEEITADLRALEEQSQGLMAEILGDLA